MNYYTPILELLDTFFFNEQDGHFCGQVGWEVN